MTIKIIINTTNIYKAVGCVCYDYAQKQLLPSKLLQLEISQGWEHNSREADTEPISNVATILTPNHQSDRTSVPNLIHAYDRASKSNEE